ncbi:Aldo/keto reductase family protein [compost metagenome]
MLEHLPELSGGKRALAHTAIRYALSSPAVACAIPGASSLEQLLQNMAAGEAKELTAYELEAIRQISLSGKYEQHR